jgi:hypothetical protein
MGWPKAWYLQHLAEQRAKSGSYNHVLPGECPADEMELHEEIILYCRNRGWGFIRANPTKKSHITLGAPDFVILANLGRVHFIECKSATGKLRTEQLGFKIQAEMNGHIVHVVRTFDEFMEIVNL